MQFIFGDYSHSVSHSALTVLLDVSLIIERGEAKGNAEDLLHNHSRSDFVRLVL